MQDDKVPLFDDVSVDTVKYRLVIITEVIITMRPNPMMLRGALCPEMPATDLANYLVKRGVLFWETLLIRYVFMLGVLKKLC